MSGATVKVTPGSTPAGLRRTWSLVFAVAVIVLLVAGCGDNTIEPSAAAAEETTTTQESPAPPVPAEQPEPAGPKATQDQTDNTSTPTASDSSETADTAKTTDTTRTTDTTKTTDTTRTTDTTKTTDTASPISSVIEPAFLFPAEEGDSGESVLSLQQRLFNLGFAPGSPDGSYGKRTVAAVHAFQGLVGLPETGIADDQTIAELATFYYDGLIIQAGDEGADVEALQQRLSDGPFDPGPVDGEYGTGTVQAVWALEKLAGVPVDGNWGPLDEKAWEELQAGSIGSPTKTHDLRWVEVDLSKQLVKVYDPGQSFPTLVSHASSGSGIPWSNEEHSGSSITPTGDFEIQRRISGWRESSLNIGRLYNPLYFRGGIAFHGAGSVPLYPASHGCVRLPMHVADYLPDLLPNGTPVHVTA